MPKLISSTGRQDTTREEVLDALLHADRAQHDELGRTGSSETVGDSPMHSSPREQAAEAISLDNVDE